MKKVAFLIPLSIFLLAACGKYENGPKFTLLSKKARIVNSWKGKQASYNGVPYSLNSTFYENTYIFKKNFEYQILGEANQIQAAEQNGTWRFDDEKESVIIEINGLTDTLIISRLKNNSLWLKKEISGNTFLYEYIPA